MPRRKKRCAADAACFPCNVPDECSFTLTCYILEVHKKKCGFGFNVSAGIQPRYAHADVSFETFYRGEGNNPANCFCPIEEVAEMTFTVDQLAPDRIIDQGTTCPDPDCAITSATGTRDEYGGELAVPCTSAPVSYTPEYCPGTLSDWIVGDEFMETIASVWNDGSASTRLRSTVGVFCGASDYALTTDEAPTHRQWTYENIVEGPECPDNGCGSEDLWTIEANGMYDVQLSDEIETSELLYFCNQAGDSAIGTDDDEYTDMYGSGGCLAYFLLSDNELLLDWQSVMVKITNTSAVSITVFWTRTDYEASDNPEDPFGLGDVIEVATSSVTLPPGGSFEVDVAVDPTPGSNSLAQLSGWRCVAA